MPIHAARHGRWERISSYWNRIFDTGNSGRWYAGVLVNIGCRANRNHASQLEVGQLFSESCLMLRIEHMCIVRDVLASAAEEVLRSGSHSLKFPLSTKSHDAFRWRIVLVLEKLMPPIWGP